MTRTNLAKYKKVQRLALQMCGNFRQNTSGDSLDVLTVTTPIDLYLREETIKSSTRLNKHFELSWVGESKTSKAGHEEEIMKELENLKIANAESDVIDSVTVLKKKFKVSTGKGGFDYNWGYRMYTDGSKTKNGVGAGIWELGHFITGHFITGHFITDTLPRGHFITRTLYHAATLSRGQFTPRTLEN